MVRPPKVLVACVLIALAGPLSAQRGPLDGTAWMAGCWEATRAGRVTTEMWMPPAGNLMIGGSRMTADGEVREFEYLRLSEHDGKVVYTAIPSGQRQTDFTATIMSDTLLVFENPQHDFPQRIAYHKRGSDSIVARVEGPGAGGRTRGFSIPMRRVSCTPVRAQSYGRGQSGPRALLPRHEEIALARSAAPAALSDSATIYVLNDSVYTAAVRGTNGAACYVSRDWIHSVEPHCFDAEGAATVLPMAMRRVELLHQGRTRDEADRDIAEGLLTGRFRLPTRPVVSYMLSSAQELVSDEGKRVGAWKPHVMIYYPYWTGAGAAGPEVMLVDAGKPTASLLVVVPTFVQPKQAAPPE